MRENTAADTPAASAEALLAMEDEEFVSCAYLSVLGRPADPNGFAEYLGHIRAGADKSEILAAIAASPEAKELDPDRLPGLAGVIRASKRLRVPLFSRRRSQRVMRRAQVLEYRLGKLEQFFGARLDKLENELGDLLNGQRRQMQGTALAAALQDPELKVKLRQMSFHARSVYSQLEDAVREHFRTSST